jgi:hypothetical protein
MEMSEARLASLVERLAIHEGNHQHLAGAAVLDDSREQPRRVELRQEFAAPLTGVALTIGAGNGFFLSDSCATAGGRADLLHDNHRCVAKSIGPSEGGFFRKPFSEMNMCAVLTDRQS